MKCLFCGACCCAGANTVSVGPLDQVPPVFLTDDGKHMRTLAGRCLALRPGNRCAIYELRPAVCQTFEPGGAGCVAIRELKGEG